MDDAKFLASHARVCDASPEEMGRTPTPLPRPNGPSDDVEPISEPSYTIGDLDAAPPVREPTARPRSRRERDGASAKKKSSPPSPPPRAAGGGGGEGGGGDLPPPSGPEPGIHPTDLTRDQRMDPDAEKVVRRLVRHGYEAYLVGGGVRDLLLGGSPKDFDVATSARPDDVRRLFRNSRIIGRRFRLVHVLFGAGKVIETATFRRTPAEAGEGDDLLIRSDNVFGDAHEDAYRRDFTINALFYDFERGAVLDWVGGMPDVEQRVVRTIGDPVTRFREDPVRILRAIKFSARLDLAIAPEVYDAIVVCRDELSRAARPRLFEEVLRLMRGGAAHRSFWLAWESGVLDVLLPELSSYLADADADDRQVFRLLGAIDRTTKERGEPLDDTVLWTVLLLEPLREACDGARDRVQAATDFLEPVVERLAVPRRIADAMRRIVAALPRLEAGRTGRMTKSALFSAASEVLALTQAARSDEGVHVPRPEPAEDGAERTTKRRRRRRRRTRPGEAPEA